MKLYSAYKNYEVKNSGQEKIEFKNIVLFRTLLHAYKDFVCYSPL